MPQMKGLKELKTLPVGSERFHGRETVRPRNHAMA
jgi:hypothetical protein